MKQWFGTVAYGVAVVFVIGYLTLLFARHMIVEAQWETDFYGCNGDSDCMHDKGWGSEWDRANQTLNEG